MSHRATQDGLVTLESSDKTWSTGAGNGKPLQDCCENPMNSIKRQKDMTLENKHPHRSEGVQYAAGEERRAITNSSRKNEAAGPGWNRHSVVDVSDGQSKSRCCKEQFCIGTRNDRFMNQGKLDVVEQEMAKMNIDMII